MHVSDPSAFAFAELASECLRTCDLLACEIDLDISSSYDVDSLLRMEENSISAMISDKKYNKMRKQFIRSFGLDIAMFDNYVPIFLVNLITESIMMREGREALDLFIWKKAIEYDIERTGLENFDAHYEILNKIPPEDQLKLLVKLSRNTKAFRKSLHTLKNLYAAGNYKMLYKMTRKSLGKLRKIMLDERNEIMVSRIEKLSEDKRLFAAMGASHLSGKNGIIAGLKRKAFTVKQMQQASSSISETEEE